MLSCKRHKLQATTDIPKQAALKPDCKPDCKAAKRCVQHKLGIALTTHNKLKCIEMLQSRYRMVRQPGMPVQAAHATI